LGAAHCKVPRLAIKGAFGVGFADRVAGPTRPLMG
jgi:hypothetical protein